MVLDPRPFIDGPLEEEAGSRPEGSQIVRPTLLRHLITWHGKDLARRQLTLSCLIMQYHEFRGAVKQL